MPRQLDLGDDDAVLEVSYLPPGAAEKVTFNVDLDRARILISDYMEKRGPKVENDPNFDWDAFHTGQQAFLTERLNLPPMSLHYFRRLVEQVFVAVKDLKKKPDGTPSSPASTESTPAS